MGGADIVTVSCDQMERQTRNRGRPCNSHRQAPFARTRRCAPPPPQAWVNGGSVYMQDRHATGNFIPQIDASNDLFNAAGFEVTQLTNAIATPTHVVTHSVSLSGVSASAFNGDTKMKAALKAALADTLGVVKDDIYDIVATSRRMRELSSTATISYKVKASSSSHATALASKATSMSAPTVSSAMRNDLVSQGVNPSPGLGVASVSGSAPTAAVPS